MGSTNIVNPLSMNTAKYYYLFFMENYALPHNYNGHIYTHSVPSSFVYNTIKDGCLWLITLIIGVGGYSIYFDYDTTISKVLSLDILNQAGVRDPALRYNSNITPWEGLLSDGKSPLAPTDHVVSGLGLPYLNGEDLLPIYRADPLQAVLPEIDLLQNKIVYDSNGVMQIKKYSFCFSEEVEVGFENESEDEDSSVEENLSRDFLYNNMNFGEVEGGNYSTKEFDVAFTSKITVYYPIYGWGMSYKVSTNEYDDPDIVRSLPLECVNDDTRMMCYRKSNQNIYCLKTKFAGKDIKYIGPDYGKPINNTEYMTRLEATPFIEWAKYHLNNEDDSIYIPLYWMAKYWAPFLSWRNGTQTNSLQVVIMASSIYTSGIMSKESMQGKSLSAIITNFLSQTLSSKEKEKLRNIVVNAQRVISLLEFIKRY